MIDRLRYLLSTPQNRKILLGSAAAIAFGFVLWTQIPHWRESIETAIIVTTLGAPPLSIFIAWQQSTWSSFESHHTNELQECKAQIDALQTGVDNVYGATQEKISAITLQMARLGFDQEHLGQQIAGLSRRIGENHESLRELEAVRKLIWSELRENRATDYKQGMEIAKLSGAWEYLSTHEVRRLQGEYDQVQAQVRGYESWREFLSVDFHKLKMEVALMQRLLSDEQQGEQDG